MHRATECIGLLNSPVCYGGQQRYEHVNDVIRRARAPQRNGKVTDETLSEAALVGAARFPPGWLEAPRPSGCRSPGAIIADARSTPDPQPRRAVGGTETATCRGSTCRHGYSDVDQRRRARCGRQSLDTLSLVQEGHLSIQTHLWRLAPIGYREVVCNEDGTAPVRRRGYAFQRWVSIEAPRRSHQLRAA